MNPSKSFPLTMKRLNTLFVLLLFGLFSTNLIAQKTVLFPPVLELGLPDETWKVTDNVMGYSLWSNAGKMIEGMGGKATIQVYCFYKNNFPNEFDTNYVRSLLNLEKNNDPKTIEKTGDFYAQPLKTGEGRSWAMAWQHTAEGYWVFLYFSVESATEKQAKESWNSILSSSKMLSVSEMDQRFGYPLDPKADNSAYIKSKREELVRFYCPTGSCTAVRSAVSKIPLKELMPEIYDGFSFEQLFRVWNSILDGTIPANDYFNSVFLNRDSPDIKLYMKYADRSDGSFYDEVDLAVVRKNLQTSFEKDTFLVEQSYSADTYYACNQSGEKTHIWRVYSNRSNDKVVVVCFHKDGKPLTDPSDWKITEAKCSVLHVKDLGSGVFRLSAYPEEDRGEEAEMRDEEFEKLMSEYKSKALAAENEENEEPLADDVHPCNNSPTNVFALASLDTRSGKSQTLFGMSTNANTSFVTVNDFPDGYEVLYTIREMNYLSSRLYNSYRKKYANISDSVLYDINLDPKLDKQFYQLNFVKKEKLAKQLDTLYLKTKDDFYDISEHLAYEVANSRLFVMQREKRLYSSGFLFDDLNGDGKKDVYRFMVSNGVLVNSMVLYEKDGGVVADTDSEKYRKRFLNSEMGKLLIRISLQEKNMLSMDYWNYPEESEGY